MVQYETREITSYLRNGSLWVGRFVVSNGELNFGDDRFDSAHGLANFVGAEPTRPANEAGLFQAWSRSANPTGEVKPAGVRKLDTVVERLKSAA